MESSPFHTDQNILGEVNAINMDQNKGSLSTELFEEKLEEINQDLRRFDAATEFHSESNSPTGKENNLELMTINEIFLKFTQSHATSHGYPRVPLFVLPDTSNINTGIQATWKRQARSITSTDVIMADAVGSKRCAHPTGGQPKLQKKKKTVSQVGKHTENQLAKLVWAKDPSVAFLA